MRVAPVAAHPTTALIVAIAVTSVEARLHALTLEAYNHEMSVRRIQHHSSLFRDVWAACKGGSVGICIGAKKQFRDRGA